MFLNLSFWGWETNLQWKMLDISMMFSTQKNHTISSESPNGSRQVDGIKTSDKLLLGHVPCVWVDTCRVFPYLGEPRKRRGSTGRNGEYIENWWVQKVWDQPPMLHYRMEPLFNFIGWVNIFGVIIHPRMRISLVPDHAGLGGRPHVVTAWGSWSGRVRTWLSSRLKKCSGNGLKPQKQVLIPTKLTCAKRWEFSGMIHNNY
jgi:hypothetical protein